jgi:hypothetical protein
MIPGRDPSTSYRCPADQVLHVPISENDRDLGAHVRCLAQADRLVAVPPLGAQARAEGSTVAGRVGPRRLRQPKLVMREVPTGIVSGLLFPKPAGVNRRLLLGPLALQYRSQAACRRHPASTGRSDQGGSPLYNQITDLSFECPPGNP